jgi:hypothetical protein
MTSVWWSGSLTFPAASRPRIKSFTSLELKSLDQTWENVTDGTDHRFVQLMIGSQRCHPIDIDRPPIELQVESAMAFAADEYRR